MLQAQPANSGSVLRMLRTRGARFVMRWTPSCPAFAQYLVDAPIPERLKGRRYGVQSYIPVEIGQIIFEGEAECHLMLLIDKALPFVMMGDSDGSRRSDAEDPEE